MLDNGSPISNKQISTPLMTWMHRLSLQAKRCNFTCCCSSARLSQKGHNHFEEDEESPIYDYWPKGVLLENN